MRLICMYMYIYKTLVVLKLINNKGSKVALYSVMKSIPSLSINLGEYCRLETKSLFESFEGRFDLSSSGIVHV